MKTPTHGSVYVKHSDMPQCPLVNMLDIDTRRFTWSGYSFSELFY